MELWDNYAPLTLDHQQLFDSLWKPLCHEEGIHISEYSFANAFIFRKRHQYVVIQSDPIFLGSLLPPPEIPIENFTPYLIPTVSPKQLPIERLKKETAKPLVFFPIVDQWLSSIHEPYSKLLSWRAETDYLFQAEKFKTLAGRALSSRRNLLHQLESNYTVHSEPLTKENSKDATKVLEQWQGQHKQGKEETDYFACVDALEFFDRLNLFGRVCYADGEPVGFSIGELLTPQTALIHLTKYTHDVKGVVPFLYHDFALHLPEGVEWINLEEDMGIESLRQAKSAYAPDLLIPKWSITY